VPLCVLAETKRNMDGVRHCLRQEVNQLQYIINYAVVVVVVAVVSLFDSKVFAVLDRTSLMALVCNV